MKKIRNLSIAALLFLAILGGTNVPNPACTPIPENGPQTPTTTVALWSLPESGPHTTTVALWSLPESGPHTSTSTVALWSLPEGGVPRF